MNKTLILSLSICLISACGIVQPYKFDIPQGNSIEQSKLDQVKVGMTPSQVVFLLGNPAIDDPFNKERWDYVYHLADKKRKISKRIVTLKFNNGKVSSIKDSKS